MNEAMKRLPQQEQMDSLAQNISGFVTVSLCKSQHLMLFMPKVYVSSKRGHVKSLKENPQIAINSKGRRSAGTSYVRGCRLLETILEKYDCKFLCLETWGEKKGVTLLSSIQYFTTAHGRRNAELSINTAFNPVS